MSILQILYNDKLRIFYIEFPKENIYFKYAKKIRLIAYNENHLLPNVFDQLSIAESDIINCIELLGILPKNCYI